MNATQHVNAPLTHHTKTPMNTAQIATHEHALRPFTTTRKPINAHTTTLENRPFITDEKGSMPSKITNRQTTIHAVPVPTARRERIVESDDVEELRASQLANVASEEIEWFFTTNDTDGPATQARAIIEGWLLTLDIAELRALILRFDPAPWPEALQEEGFENGYALAISLVSTGRWHAESRVHHEEHRRASDRLEAAVRKHGVKVMRGISRRADWDFADAVCAYAKARGRTSSVVPNRAA